MMDEPGNIRDHSPDTRRRACSGPEEELVLILIFELGNRNSLETSYFISYAGRSLHETSKACADFVLIHETKSDKDKILF